MISVTRSIYIQAPVERVRAQFADLVHHRDQKVHRGVTFAVLSDDGLRCDYEQRTRVGPVQFRQRIVLDRADLARQVNTIEEGPFAGGCIVFEIEAEGEASRVTATLTAPPGPPVVGTLLARSAGRSLARALAEDRDDLESDRYPA